MTFFDYFQVGSVIVFLLIIVSRAVYMNVARNVNPIVIGGGKKGLALVTELLSFAGLVVWIIELVFYASHSSFHIFPAPFTSMLIESLIAKWLGVVFVLIGGFVFILAFFSFGDSWRVGFDIKTPGPLVTTGVFAFSRNPIYLFIDLWFFGIFLINGRLIFLIFALLTLLAVHWQIFQEEAYLRSLYGDTYERYCARTRRYI